MNDSFEFGDIELADAWDADPTIDPMQVAMRLYELRRAVELLAGRDAGEWEDLSRRDRDDGLAIGVIVVDYVVAHEPDNPARAAEKIHNARRHLDGGDIPEWADLTADERQIGIELMTLILLWLQTEGPR
jgi:hypothetical protein